jgi:hypothetical protein
MHRASTNTTDRAAWVAARLTSVLLGVALLLAGGAHASKMYRCGSVYQDRPCDAAQEGKVVGHTSTPGSAPARTAVDAECTQRGADSQKVMWVREAGKTEAEQLAGATTTEQRKLVGAVYRRHGSSIDVRSAIESDCMADKQRAAQAAALIEAAAKLQDQGASGQGAPAAAAAAAASASPPARAAGIAR